MNTFNIVSQTNKDISSISKNILVDIGFLFFEDVNGMRVYCLTTLGQEYIFANCLQTKFVWLEE